MFRRAAPPAYVIALGEAARHVREQAALAAQPPAQPLADAELGYGRASQLQEAQRRRLLFDRRPDKAMSYGEDQEATPQGDLGLNIDSMWAKLYERRPDLLMRDGPALAAEMSGGRINATRFGELTATLGAPRPSFSYGAMYPGWPAPCPPGSIVGSPECPGGTQDGLGYSYQLPAGAIGLPPTQKTPQGTVRSWDYQGVEFTIDTMRRLVRDSLVKEQSMAIRRLAERIIAAVHAKDYQSEVAAIYYWVLVNLRYVRDPTHIELVQSPLQVLQPTPYDRAAGRSAAQEDCETMTSTLAALCMSIGNQCEFVTISTQRGVGYHHVLCVVTLPSGQKVVLDPVGGPQVTQMLRSIVQHQSWPVEPVRVPGRTGFLPSVSGSPDARWGRSLDISGLGTEWTVADRPAHEGFGLPPFGGIMEST